jgi:hypothetical protein
VIDKSALVIMLIYFYRRDSMPKPQTTYTIRINGELGNLQEVLTRARGSLEGFFKTGQAPAGLEKLLEKTNELLS